MDQHAPKIESPVRTEADYALWREALEHYLREPGNGWLAFMREGVPFEAWCAGCWLGQHLDELHADPAAASAACFALGQTIAHRPDPWPYAADALRKFLAGMPDVPGPDLALRLLRETHPGLVVD